MSLPPYRVEHRSTTASTMDDVRAAALAGAADGLVIRADEQTGGRGRRGRSWHSPSGNLYVSLLICPPAGADYGHYSFIAALALAEALPGVVVPDRIRLKWPNDVLVDGAKIAGILLERCATPSGEALIIGMGVNIAHCPDDTAYPVTSLTRLGCDHSLPIPAALLDRILPRLRQWRTQLEQEGFPPVRTAWLQRATGLEAAMTVRLPDRELNGDFMGIDESGYLLLRGQQGRLSRIAAGDVFVHDRQAG